MAQEVTSNHCLHVRAALPPLMFHIYVSILEASGGYILFCNIFDWVLLRSRIPITFFFLYFHLRPYESCGFLCIVLFWTNNDPLVWPLLIPHPCRLAFLCLHFMGINAGVNMIRHPMDDLRISQIFGKHTENQSPTIFRINHLLCDFPKRKMLCDDQLRSNLGGNPTN